MLKSTLQMIYTSCVKKTAAKNTKYSRKESILIIGHHANPIAHAKSLLWVKNKIHFGSTNKIPKNMLKSILQMIYTSCVQKPLQKTPNIREMKAFL